VGTKLKPGRYFAGQYALGAWFVGFAVTPMAAEQIEIQPHWTEAQAKRRAKYLNEKRRRSGN